MEDWIVSALGVAGCALGAGLVASVEVALAGIPEARVRQDVESNLIGARSLAHIVTMADRVWGALQVLRTAAWLGVAVLSVNFAHAHAQDLSDAVVVLLVTVISVPVIHFIPRTLGKRYARTWARLSAPVVRTVAWLLFPLVWPGLRLVRWVGGATGEGPYWTSDELVRLSTEARTDSLGKSDEDLLLSIIEFSDTVIREIMVPRTEMVAIPLNSDPDAVRRTVIEGGHSRIPVYGETVDNIVGLLHVKDLFRAAMGNGNSSSVATDLDIHQVLRPTFYVPEVMKISELLREFQRRKTHMAIVVDEYGGTAGVVTLEDIIEEIVGEIQDEYDVEEKQFRVLSETKIIADGRVNIYELEEVLGVSFPEDSGFETLAGFLMYTVGYLPEPGAVIDWGGLRFTVKEANEKRIATVEIERPHAAERAPAER